MWLDTVTIPDRFAEVPDIPDDIRAELSDGPHALKKHYSVGTYSAGCRGPLCRQAETDRGRRRTEANCIAEGKEYIFHPYASVLMREAEIGFYARWHIYERDEYAKAVRIS